MSSQIAGENDCVFSFQKQLSSDGNQDRSERVISLFS